MVTDTDEPRTDDIDQEDEEGGPVKPFLDHLEDLRWVLIKSLSAVGIAILVCLLGGNYVTAVLLRPLNNAKVRYPSNVQVVTLLVGTNRVGNFQLNPKAEGLSFGTNRFSAYQLQPITISGNSSNPVTVLGMRPDPQAARDTEQKLNIPVSNIGPASAFLVAFQIAIYAGLVIAAPFIMFFVGTFVFPALKLKEKKYTYRGLFFGVGLFMSGVLFCYFALMPLALVASVQYSQWLGFGVPLWRAEEYIGFVCKFMLGMGLGFELPVVVLTLVRIGVLNYAILSKARRYVIVINFVLGALLTTPEVITQTLMAIPLQVLYEISVWITWYWERKQRKKEEQEAAGGVPA